MQGHQVASRRHQVPLHLVLVLLLQVATTCAFSLAANRGLAQEWKTMFPPAIRPLTVRRDVSTRDMVVFEQPHQLGNLYKHRIRHAIYRLKDGTVIVYNPIAPTEETLHEAVEAFGKEPDHIVVPTNSYEHLTMVSGWTARFPQATFWSLPGVDLEGARIRKDLSEDGLPQNWREELALSILEASPVFRECYLLHRPTRTVFTIDSFNMIADEHIGNRVAKLALQAAGRFNEPWCNTRALMWDDHACRTAVARVLSWDFDTVVPTHGVCPVPNAKQALAHAFSYLL